MPEPIRIPIHSCQYDTEKAREVNMLACPTDGCVCEGLDNIEVGDWFWLNRTSSGRKPGAQDFDLRIGDWEVRIALHGDGTLQILPPYKEPDGS